MVWFVLVIVASYNGICLTRVYNLLRLLKKVKFCQALLLKFYTRKGV